MSLAIEPPHRFPAPVELARRRTGERTGDPSVNFTHLRGVANRLRERFQRRASRLRVRHVACRDSGRISSSPSADSSTLVLGMLTTGGEAAQPATVNRVIWGALMGGLASLLIVGGVSALPARRQYTGFAGAARPHRPVCGLGRAVDEVSAWSVPSATRAWRQAHQSQSAIQLIVVLALAPTLATAVASASSSPEFGWRSRSCAVALGVVPTLPDRHAVERAWDFAKWSIPDQIFVRPSSTTDVRARSRRTRRQRYLRGRRRLLTSVRRFPGISPPRCLRRSAGTPLLATRTSPISTARSPAARVSLSSFSATCWPPTMSLRVSVLLCL